MKPRINEKVIGRTGPASVRSCGCDVQPWEDCEHTAWDAGLSLDRVIASAVQVAEPIPAYAPEKPASAALAVALAFHEAYERLAPLNGYETRKETRHFDPKTANGRTMLAVCAELLRTDVIRVRQV